MLRDKINKKKSRPLYREKLNTIYPKNINSARK
jgi:hypothetical protein